MSGDEEQYCADLVRQGDRERWLCALFAPEPMRGPALALAAFNLELARIRDHVREPHMALIRLQWWRETVEGCAAGTPRRHPVAAALGRTVAQRPETMAPLLQQMIDARERDIEEIPFADIADLLAYADGTSGALARALSLVSGDGAQARALETAAAIGRGWGLVEALRGAARQAARRRCVLPSGLLAAQGVGIEDWFGGRAGPRAAAAVEEIARIAGDSLASAGRGCLRPGMALGGLGVLARDRLRRLARVGHDCFAPAFFQDVPSDAPRLAAAWLLRRW